MRYLRVNLCLPRQQHSLEPISSTKVGKGGEEEGAAYLTGKLLSFNAFMSF
jgi:hypothetical protein